VPACSTTPTFPRVSCQTALAGYPEGHQDSESLEEDIKHLKEKVDAGADFIITQLFYDVDAYLDWVKKVRAIGITVPIIPGIMPVHTYAGWKRMTTLCKTGIPPEMAENLERIKDDDQAVKKYGVQWCIGMVRRLLETGVKRTARCLRAAIEKTRRAHTLNQPRRWDSFSVLIP